MLYEVITLDADIPIQVVPKQQDGVLGGVPVGDQVQQIAAAAGRIVIEQGDLVVRHRMHEREMTAPFAIKGRNNFV